MLRKGYQRPSTGLETTTAASTCTSNRTFCTCNGRTPAIISFSVVIVVRFVSSVFYTVIFEFIFR